MDFPVRNTCTGGRRKSSRMEESYKHFSDKKRVRFECDYTKMEKMRCFQGIFKMEMEVDEINDQQIQGWHRFFNKRNMEIYDICHGRFA
jgi:hypothetical protein